MAQEVPADAGSDDAITQYETALDAFAEQLRDLHIQCGKPKQSMLVERAARRAAKNNNDKFRLHAGTLSQVLSGKKAPSYDFLAALIGQLTTARPDVIDSGELWPQWDKRWQHLMRLRGLADAQRHRQRSATSPAPEAQGDATFSELPDETAGKLESASPTAQNIAAQILNQAREEADALRAAASREAAALLAQARDEAAHILARARHEAAVDVVNLPGPKQAVVDVYVYRDVSDGIDRALCCPMAHSGTTHQAEDLRRQLGHLFHVESVAGHYTPSQLRCFLTSGEAAVIHRWPTTNQYGQSGTAAHVLVGPPHLLPASGSLLIDGPDRGWFANVSGAIPPIPVASLQRQIETNRPRYIEHIDHIRFPLVGAAAQLMRTPQSRLSFTAPEDVGLPPDINFTRLLMWGLCAMFETALGDDYFTYSTLQRDDFEPIGPKGFTGPGLVQVAQWHPAAADDPSVVRHRLENFPFDETNLLAAKLTDLFLAATHHPEETPGLLALRAVPSDTFEQRMEALIAAVGQLPVDR